MKKMLLAVFMLSVFTMRQDGAQAAPEAAAPAYQVTAVQSAAKAINYRDLKGSVAIDFKGTVLLPYAKGMAEVRNRAGVTAIEANFQNLTAATQFGPEYLTYILWAISPDGRATSLGELIVKNGKSQMSAQTPLQALSLIVTAEPYFAVTQPSNAVILENAIKPGNKDKIELIDAKYELLPRGQYTKNIAATDLKPQVLNKKTPFYVYQARNAVRIAKAEGAEAYAADGLKNAERLLALSETKAGGKKGQSMTAREAVQSAEDSRSLSVRRQADEALANEHQEARDQVAGAMSQAATATAAQAKAAKAQLQAESAKAKSDLERSVALAMAASAVATSTAAQADSKAAQASAEQAKGQAAIANDRAQKAEGEKALLRAQLLQQLNSVLQTRDTARGLIVNMSDALFPTGSATLQSPVREKLAKVAGIVSSQSGLKLSVEGHTDSVGSEAYNQRLSEKRAQSARDYLVSQGVSADSIVSRGYGKSSPIASNDTPQGRAQNRRVEIIVSGEAIGTLAMGR